MHKHYNGNVLSYIGDAVISLKVREYLISLGYTKSKDLQEKSIVYVSANGQAKFMEDILEKEILNDEELRIYKRGRNANMGATAKNASVVVYRVASGYEALIGYLYYEDKDRLETILEMMINFYADEIK